LWNINNKGQREFSKEDWSQASELARQCPLFKPDDEDEMVADEPISCYNCLYRRWTEASFVCCK